MTTDNRKEFEKAAVSAGIDECVWDEAWELWQACDALRQREIQRLNVFYEQSKLDRLGLKQQLSAAQAKNAELEA